MRYPIILQKDPDSDYGVTVPDLPGCFSAGETMEYALENAEEAILTHLEGLLMDNDPIPSPSTMDSLKKNRRGKDIIWGIVSVDVSKLSERAKRINITVSEKLLTKIDSFAEKEGETRSGLLVSAALEYIACRSARE
jgi:predicted RNase H-like HicB family nuclease